MKILLVCAAVVAVASAQFESNGFSRSNGNGGGGGGGGARPVYGPPEKEFEPEPQGPPQQNGQQQGEAFQPTTYRHVFVHSAPDEPVDEQARIIRVPGGDKHVNIIFVKTPSQSSSAQTEVILPEQDEHKNLVYVLLKKNEAESNIKIRRPNAKRPQSPEVYFIRYKDQEEQKENGASGGYQQGPSNGGYQQQRPQNGESLVRPAPHHNGNGNGNGHHNGNGNGNGHHNGNGNGHHNGNGNGHHNGNGNGNGHSNGNGSPYSEAGRYTPSVAPGPIRSPADIPSSGYGVPL